MTIWRDPYCSCARSRLTSTDRGLCFGRSDGWKSSADRVSDMPYALIIEETSSEFFTPKTQGLVTELVATLDPRFKDSQSPCPPWLRGESRLHGSLITLGERFTTEPRRARRRKEIWQRPASSRRGVFDLPANNLQPLVNHPWLRLRRVMLKHNLLGTIATNDRGATHQGAERD